MNETKLGYNKNLLKQTIGLGQFVPSIIILSSKNNMNSSLVDNL